MNDDCKRNTCESEESLGQPVHVISDERKTDECESEESLGGPVRMTSDECKTDKCESEESLGGPVFVPSLYIQRYYFVQQLLIKHKVTSVVDFGSAECKISRFLVQIPSVENIALVDIDGSLLKSNRFMIRPLTCDYLDRREVGLVVRMFEGSATELDDVIVGFDAVTMVEIIEHLYPDVLRAARDMIFGRLRPRVLVITTPNSDYNQLFPGFSGFRHWDHKFEWTRDEFKCWCDDITTQYPYTVELTGVGEAPLGSQHLGHCSQIAIFVRNVDTPQICDSSGTATHNYKLIAENSYPYKQTPNISEADSMLMEISYLLKPNVGILPDEWEESYEDAGYQENELCYLVPISFLMKHKRINTKFDLKTLREYLQNHGYRIAENRDCIILPVPEDDWNIQDYSDHDDVNSDRALYCTQNCDAVPPCDEELNNGRNKTGGGEDIVHKIDGEKEDLNTDEKLQTVDKGSNITGQFLIECMESWD